ncbi:hypothetical protein COCNU_10G006730 [Cocos nucifera]|uniref:DUF4378 domain-containing protein n=1 Tax=Cocos nucifera TaxID=13894 RepID=A0A8K0N910_COCNU|nr:hypothetical protein COCNU_10G006730 [Cocos nucifera]
MGREWHWSRSLAGEEKESPGCMSGMLHYFDFHHLLFTASSPTVQPELSSEVHHPTSQPKGMDAPRNSLELDEGKASSTLAIAEEYYDVPIGRQVVPKPAALAKRSKMASSPTTPCQKSPPSVESQEQSQNKNKKKKLKDEYTPRMSSSRSWDSDPRFSLQLNKENTNRAMQEFGHLSEVSGDSSLPPSPLPSMVKSRKKDLGRHQNENKSPRSNYCAREIVKQVKESISSRKGGSSDEIAVGSEQKASCHADPWNQTKPPMTDPPPSCSSPRMTIGVDGDLMPLKTPRRRLPKERDPEYRYLRSILDLAGVTGVAIPSFRWYSSSLPIDPIIFHQLELRLPSFPTEEEQTQSKSEKEVTLLGSLRQRWNRKLLFHLVEEIMGDLLRWSYLTNPTTHRRHPIKQQAMDGRGKADGELLLRELWRQIRSFPAADCQVVGDIDALVAGDMPEAKVRRLLLHPSVMEEAEDIALELEQEIFDGLLVEAAASIALDLTSPCS